MSGLKCFLFQSIYCVCLCFLILMINFNYLSDAKNLHSKEEKSCEHVKHYFDSINVTINPVYDSTGKICSGHCCDDSTEYDLQLKSTKNFERLVKHHTRSQRGIWETTSNIFRDHVLELSRQSENKTLNLFAQVYRKMSPLSREPILELYRTIRNHLQLKSNSDDLELVVEKFFIQLFPVAYHHAVHSEASLNSQESSSSSNSKSKESSNPIDNRDFHSDYKNCLTHTYYELQPFGDIPKRLTQQLVQSVSAATVFLRALDKGAEVLIGAEELNSENLLQNCKSALLKMNYCASCKGHNHNHAKPCYGYCVNVMRGCLTQYVGSLDQDWYSFSEAIERLLTLVRSKDGIEFVIKGLDGKLSEAIMYAMENGPELEKKVKKACGTPTLIQGDKLQSVYEQKTHQIQHTSKWISPPDTQMLHFLVTLDKTKGFFLKIADSLCEDEDYQHTDKDCWTGDHMGDYTQSIIQINSQKYNPEVPFTTMDYPRDSKLHMLIDKLISLRNMVMKPLNSQKPDSDKMLSDMAEGSGGSYYGENGYPDDDDYGDNGSGSGDGGKKSPPIIDVHSNNFTPSTGGSYSINSHSLLTSSSIYLLVIYFSIILINRRH
uniref:Putative heparin sulfate cell surface proteoglycan n=1 Tax=Corethrella appendiculata TaxID=1370023 RepID=U5ESP5_9DIPT